MRPTLALFEDVFQNDAAVAAPLPARPRVAFVVHGAVTIAGRAYGDGEAWCGEDAIAPRAGAAGATVWRWELAAAGQMPESAPGLRSLPKLAVPLDTLPAGGLLLRGDSVAFGPGSCAYRHVHQGPGIRCLIEGWKLSLEISYNLS